jgi:hypothetical protein
VNDRLKVVLISAALAAGAMALYWLAGAWAPALRTDVALGAAVPLVVALCVLAPIIRGIRR